MAHAVALVPVSDSFSDILPRLIAAAGADCESVFAPGDLPRDAPVSAVLVCAAGREGDALAVVRAFRESQPCLVGVIGTEADHTLARQLRRGGADDYFVFPAEVGELRTWLQEVVAASARRVAVRSAEEVGANGFARLIGSSRPLRTVLECAALLRDSGSSTVLITGETGTGKDVLAQALHEAGPRAAARFVEVNCAALPANLLEAELFGYEKGAFTDARSAKVGLVEAADGGTLFLDEIGDLPLELQGKLLRFLETKRSRRLGAVREIEVDTRVVAATHVDLEQRVRERRFREDLFYRLDVLTLTLPPLRDREGDPVLLAEHFAREFGATYALKIHPFAPDVRSAIATAAWPGNVRQLRNAVERAVILGRGEITVQNLRLGGRPVVSSAGVLPFPATMDSIQAAAAQAAVAACAGNKSRAADLLGISRKGLYALLRSAPEKQVDP
jgi:DNA-binding NtrC family response regulator